MDKSKLELIGKIKKKHGKNRYKQSMLSRILKAWITLLYSRLQTLLKATRRKKRS